MDITQYPVVTRVTTLSLLLGTLSGCDLFNKDDETEAPEASFSVNETSGTAPVTVAFTDTSEDGSEDIYQWLWEFGDGNTSSLQNPQHDYPIPGTYTVSLTVTSEDGADTETRTDLISVEALPPVAAFSVSSTTGDAPLTVTFSEDSTQGTGTINQWAWDFGDGNTSTESSPEHTYTEPGEYTVSLTVSDEYSSHTVTATEPVVVLAVPPEAAMEVSVTSGDMPFTVTFTDTSSAGSGEITQRLWDFGDGTTSEEANPTHTYTEAGKYSVTLTVTADSSDSVTQLDWIEVVDPYITLTINMRGSEGEDISDVTVLSSDYEIESYSKNEYQQLLIRLLPQDNASLLRIAADGYTDALVYFDGAMINQSKNVTFKKLGQGFEVDTTIGGEFVTGDGAKLTVPAYSLQTIDGTILSDTATLTMTTVDISDALDRNAFPGSFMGEATDLPGEPVEIASYGSVEMTFTYEGETLQLIPGYTMELEVPLFVAQHLGGDTVHEGDNIPFWILDEETGIWMQEGMGEVVTSTNSPTGFALKATTSHFSWFNADAWSYPGAGPVAPGSDLPGEQRSKWCDITINITGPNEGSGLAGLMARTTPGWPYSVISSAITYSGKPVESRVMSGSYYSFTLSDGFNYSKRSFVCLGEDIELNMTLPDDEKPQFTSWSASLLPKFEEVDGHQTITKNILTVGGGFIQDEDNTVEVYSIAITGGGTRLPEGAEAKYLVEEDDAASPINVYALLENSYGDTRLDFSLSYVSEQAPTVFYYYLYADLVGKARLSWKTEGADNVDIVYFPSSTLEQPISFIGNLSYEQEGEHNFLLSDYGIDSLDGYIQIRWWNQYGEQIYYIELATETQCLTDMCFAS